MGADALLGLACLYGIELLDDNTIECRERLHGIFAEAYSQRFGTKARDAVLAAARIIVNTNIVQGDALIMTTNTPRRGPLQAARGPGSITLGAEREGRHLRLQAARGPGSITLLNSICEVSAGLQAARGPGSITLGHIEASHRTELQAARGPGSITL